MKIAKTLLIGLATVSLAACSKGVSRKEFVEEAQKVEKDNYTKAVVSYSYYIKTTGYKDLGFGEDESVDLKGEIKLSLSGGEFTYDAGQEVPEQLEGLNENLNRRVTDAIAELPAEGSSQAKYYTYHTAPLAISMSAKQSSKDQSGSGTVSISAYMEFDNHGLLVKMTSDMTSSMSVKADKTYKVTSTEKTSYTITYQE